MDGCRLELADFKTLSLTFSICSGEKIRRGQGGALFGIDNIVVVVIALGSRNHCSNVASELIGQCHAVLTNKTSKLAHGFVFGLVPSGFEPVPSWILGYDGLEQADGGHVGKDRRWRCV